jgi:putative transposase
VAAHLAQADDPLVTVAPVLERYGSFADILRETRDDDEARWRALRMSEKSGRPLGRRAWLDMLEAQTGRTLKPQKRGPKPKGEFGVFSALSR